MTAKNLLPLPDESEADSFDDLMHRFLMATLRLQLADNAMRLLNKGDDYGPAQAAVEEATEALVQIQCGFQQWDDQKRRRC